MISYIPVEKKSEFTIANPETDIEDFNYVKSFWDWDGNKREKEFVKLATTISKLVSPSHDCLPLLKKEEVKVTTFKENNNAWVRRELVKKKKLQVFTLSFFAVEGIRKSPEFCFQLILRQVVYFMTRRMLMRNKKFYYEGPIFKWCLNEINKRLGMVNYKIYDDLNVFEQENGNTVTIEVRKELDIKEEVETDLGNAVKEIENDIGNDTCIVFNYNIREAHSKTNTVSR